MTDRDIWITASAMIDQFGDEAAERAAACAEAYRLNDDAEGQAICKRVLRAIGILTSLEASGLVH